MGAIVHIRLFFFTVDRGSLQPGASGCSMSSGVESCRCGSCGRQYLSRQSDSFYRHGRRVMSKPTRRAGRVHDDSVAVKQRHSTQSCRARDGERRPAFLSRLAGAGS
jgi:hypothetical protein